MSRSRPTAARLSGATLVGAIVLALAACVSGGSRPDDKSSGPALPTVKADAALHAQLPAKIRKAGRMVVVNPGTNEPWWSKSGDSYSGVAASLVEQMGKVLGIRISYVAVPDLAAAFATVSSGRYDAGFNPYGDTGSTNVDVIDVVKEIVPFLVKKGNPKKIGTMASLCGKAVAATGPAGKGSAYYILQQQDKKCRADGANGIRIVAITGVPAGVLAVKSGRADAYFSSGAPLFYYAAHSDGSLQVVGTDTDTGFDNLYQGMIVPEGSPLAKPVLAAFRKVFASGAYARLMRAAGLQREMIDAPGINLASTK